MSTQLDFTLNCASGLYRLDAANKKAIFYLMNTSRNRNRWSVTAKALDEAGPTLIKKPLGMGAGYKSDKHYPDGSDPKIPKQTMDVGIFTDIEIKGNVAFGPADISDDKTLSMLQDGKLGPVSSVIQPYYMTCSKCGVNLDRTWEQHECIASDEGYAVVHSFSFIRYDFVDVPAYPQAGFMNFAAQKDGAVPLALLAGVYESGVSKIMENKKLSEKENEKFVALEQNNQKLETALKKAQEDASTNKTKVEELGAKLKAFEDEKHAGLVEQAYKARVKAGVAGEEAKEREMLTAQADNVLKMLAVDAEKVVSKLSAQGPPKPELKYTQENQGTLEAAMSAERKRLGYPEIKSKEEKA